MKLRVVMKCRDSLEFAIKNAEYNAGFSWSYEKKKEVDTVVNKYLRYGEVLTVIVDTENQTCIVEEV